MSIVAIWKRRRDARFIPPEVAHIIVRYVSIGEDAGSFSADDYLCVFWARRSTVDMVMRHSLDMRITLRRGSYANGIRVCDKCDSVRTKLKALRINFVEAVPPPTLSHK